MKNKKIIALAAKVGAGKSFFTDFVRENYSADYFRFSDSLKEILDILDLEKNRDNLQNLSKILRAEFGENILEKSILKKIKNSQKEILILDGVRRKSDIDYFLNLDNFYLIYIEVDEEKRLERILNRQGDKEDDKEMTLEKLKEAEKHNSELQADIKEISNFVIDNNGSQEEFEEKIKELMKKI